MSNNIKELVEHGYIVVCDTNVFLHIYRYSPEFSDFALRCISVVEPYIIIPSTVRFEFLRHYRAYFGKMGKRVKRVGDDTKQKIINADRKVLKICDNLQALQYPDIEELRENLSGKFDELLSITEAFFEDRTILELIANPWGDKNLVYDLIEQIINDGRCMESVTQEEIYQICEEGEQRYTSQPPIPPGFKDAKDKDGVRKYSDLIIWKEILHYAKDNSANVLFVTDYVKSDWWIEENGIKLFHPYLQDEFEKETGTKIVPFCALDFFEEVSTAYQIKRTDAVEIALRITDDEYFERVQSAVFDRISDTLVLSGEEYIAPDSHVGTNGIDELEIIDQDFISAEQIQRDQDTITYIFEYKIKAEATSFDYWGKDNDTKEILLGPAGSHIFAGEIEVEVVRETDMYLDFKADDGFESVVIVSGNLKEISYQPFFGDGEEEYWENFYSICPDCGCKINLKNDGGNGFCIKCAVEH